MMGQSTERLNERDSRLKKVAAVTGRDGTGRDGTGRSTNWKISLTGWFYEKRGLIGPF